MIMMRKMTRRVLSALIAIVMLVGMVPANMIAETTSISSVTNYDDFMTTLKDLEGYADAYAAEIYGKDPAELVLNFIRTGVERYQDDNWNTLAGYENTGFTTYVAAQDAENGTSAMALKDIVIKDFVLDNQNKTDFGHMFGCMNISYVAPGSADLSGWAGDICDLLQYSVANIADINKNTDGSVEEMAAYIQEHCFGVDASGAFGWDDFYGDMDAFYLITEYNKAKAAGSTTKFSALMEAYFTADLSDVERTVYFMNNRFGVADNQEAVRKAIFESYSTDVGISILEAKRGLSSYSALRQACCYAVADYIYSQAKGQLVEGTVSGDVAQNGYYTVFSTESSILAPGITQDIKYAQTVDGKQIVYYVATVDVTRDDVDIVVNYNNASPPVVGSNIGLQSVREQVEALVNKNKDKEHFYPIVATNGAGYNITNGTPAGLVVMQGVEYFPVGAPGFFAILEDGSAVIGDQAKYAELKAQNKVKEAIQAFGSVLIKDGKINVIKSANYTANRASRTAVGIKADGSVVMMVLDGRQLPFSAGGSMEEIAQIMLEAGCVQAVNLDGGGSTTYMSKPAGSDEIDVVNRPSDGYERNVATSLVAISTAPPSTAFDSAIISSDYEYITAGTTMQFSATGVSNTGNAAAIPEGAYWRVSDEALASIDANGLFTAKDYGAVTVEFIVDNEVVGSKVINVVIPDDIKFVEDRITAIYGVPKELSLSLWYQGYPVAFNMETDVYMALEDGKEYAGTIDNVTFTPDENSGLRTVLVAAFLLADEELFTFATINLYHKDEATFDFANATMGNRSFAWNRVIENAKTLDNQLYRISDPDSPIVIDYTFALDMTAIDFPAQLEPMKSMLPTYSESSTAWDYLLQLAERVCTQTKVTIRAEFSPDLDVDISELNILTEYFTPTMINLDANNVLTIVCNWVNQSQPIDPATANSLCLLTGIKATVKDTAAYFDNKIAITNNGTVSYDIYLAASSLYSFAQDPANQAKYGLYPYIHEEDCRSDFATEDPNAGEEDATATNNDKGAHFSGQYVDFADVYIINSEILNGWHEEGSDYYYYVNNEALTGIQLVPDRHNASQDRFYEFGEDGKLISEQGTTGLIEFNGDLYYAVMGVAQTGWQQPVDGKYYYFHPDTGKALDGVQKIKEFVYPATAAEDPSTATYTYTFTNYVLTRGDLRKETAGGITGWRYRWAGDWIANGWFEVDGNTYHVDSHRAINGKSNWGCFITTGYGHYIATFGAHEQETYCYLFDENGVLQKDFTGAAYIASRNEYRYFVDGVLYATPGMAQGDDGYYYYVSDNWDGTVVVGKQHEVTGYLTRNLVPAGTYTFDAQGRLVEALTSVTEVNTTADSLTIQGVVATVKNDKASVITCKVGENYVVVSGTLNADGSYNFIVPKGATEVELRILGDTDGNGSVTEQDQKVLYDALMGTDDPDALEKLLLDVNGNGELNIADLAELIRSMMTEEGIHKDLEW